MTQKELEILYAKRLQEIRNTFPKFSLRYKETSLRWVWKLGDILLKILSRGKNVKTSTTYYTTVPLLNALFLPGRPKTSFWASMPLDQKIGLLSHEFIHFLQAGHTLRSKLAYTIRYLVSKRYRRRAEMGGYSATLLFAYKLSGRLPTSLRDRVAAQFYGPAYSYMWSQSEAVRWVTTTVKAVEEEKLTWADLKFSAKHF